jgi:hypothetical protein
LNCGNKKHKGYFHGTTFGKQSLQGLWWRLEDNTTVHLHEVQGCVKKSWTGHLEQELQMVQLSATRCICVTILLASLMSFVAITLCVASQWVLIVLISLLT